MNFRELGELGELGVDAVLAVLVEGYWEGAGWGGLVGLVQFV